MFKVTLTNLGQKYTAKGDTLEEALNNLEFKTLKGKTVVRVEKGDKVKERVISPVHTFRVFLARGIAKEAALKSFAATIEI